MMSVVLLALAVVATVLVSLAISSVVETYQAKKEMVDDVVVSAKSYHHISNRPTTAA